MDFIYGDQWDDNIREARRKEGRPCLTENRLLSFVHKVQNDMRQSNPSIIPKPVDSNSDPETADIMGGLIRNIQYVSDAETVYDTAVKNSITAGIGWIRIHVDYADYKSFDKEPRLMRVVNPFSCYIDPSHEKMDGSDARYAFIIEDFSRSEFKRKWPEANEESFASGIEGWCDEDSIRVAEYFYKDYEDKTLYRTQSGVYFEDEIPLLENVIEERVTTVCKIKYAKITGSQILEEGDILGQYIPLVPVYGEEAFTDGKRQMFSMIHQAKEPQKMFNYMKTASVEVLALQPKTPYIGAVGSFNTNSRQWVDANNTNPAFLEYDVVYDRNGMTLPAPQRQPAPQGSMAMMQETMNSADGIKSVLGIFDASLGNQSADISGKAIIARQVQGDNSNFHFIDNLATALKQVGRILIDIIPLYYDSARVIRVIGEDKNDRMIPLNQPVVKEGKDYRPASYGEEGYGIIDLGVGKYDIVVEVGAAYATKRQEAANSIIEIARINPRILDVAGDILIDSLDIPNGNELTKRIRSVMDPAMLGDDLEAKRLQGMTKALNELQQRLQQTEAALLTKQDNEKFKNQLEAQKVQIEQKKVEIQALESMAEIQKKQAETQEIRQELSMSVSKLSNEIADIAGAIEIILSAKEEEVTGIPEMPELGENVQ